MDVLGCPYCTVLFQKYHKNYCLAFSATKERLDTFFFQLIGDRIDYGALWKVVKMVLVLTHGQSEVEWGFSTNKDILANNMGEDTVVAFKQVHDGIKSIECDISDMDLSKELIHSVKQARMRYGLFVDQQKQEQKNTAEVKKRKRIQDDLSDCQKKQKFASSVTLTLNDSCILFSLDNYQNANNFETL